MRVARLETSGVARRDELDTILVTYVDAHMYDNTAGKQ